MSDLMPWMAPWSGRILALLLFVAGLTMTCRALFPSKPDGRPRCPKCWYDLTGGISQTCPECGHTPIRRDRPGKIRRHYKTALLSLLFAIALPLFVVQRRVRVYGWVYYTYYGPIYYFSPMKQIAHHRINEVTFGIYSDRRDWNYDTICRIKSGSNTLYELTDYRIELGARLPDDSHIGMGEDITDDGRPNVIITTYSGGAHCCTEHILFDIQDGSANEIARITPAHGNADFTDIDGDGDLEVSLHDWTFAYWNTSFASSPAPRIVLQYDGTTYRTAPHLMAAPPPPPEQWNQLAHQVHQSLTNNEQLWPSSALWSTMLDLIYTGHTDLAWQFLDESWPTDRPGKELFAEDFQLQLNKSPYWVELAKHATRTNQPQ